MKRLTPGGLHRHADGSVSWMSRSGQVHRRRYVLDRRALLALDEKTWRRGRAHLERAKQSLLGVSCDHCDKALTAGNCSCIHCDGSVCLYCLQDGDVETQCLQVLEPKP